MEIHGKFTKRLLELLPPALSQVKVQHGCFLDWRTTTPLLDLNSVPPASGPVRKALERYVSDEPISDFVTGTLSREIHQSHDYVQTPDPRLLTDLDAYRDLPATAQRLVDLIQTLPWQYTISLELPKAIGQHFAQTGPEFDFGGQIRLVTPTQAFTATYPVLTGDEAEDRSVWTGAGLGLLFTSVPGHWNENTAYLQVVTDGFVGKFADTGPIESAIISVKAILGMGLALGLLAHTHGHTWSPPRSYVLVHRNHNGTWRLDDTRQLPEDMSRVLRGLTLNTLNDTSTSEDLRPILRHFMSLFGVPLRAAGTGGRIISAAQWLFDSYTVRNELLALVQTMVALEILLGDKSLSDKLGLGELLGNRCAYLLGKSRGEREQLLQDFRLIYDLRSRIVHRGGNRLTAKERELSQWARWICRRVLHEEIKLLRADSTPSGR